MPSHFARFLKEDIWRIPKRTLKGPQGLLVRVLRIGLATQREFASDQCALRASALTFYSLLSIVPVFAMAFGIAKGFGLDKVLREKIVENTASQQEIFGRVLEFSENLLQNTKGGLVAGIGLALLFWTIIQVLSNIEEAFNHIWGFKKPRSIGRKFTDYLSLMLIAPVFFIIASSATVFAASQVKMITEKVAILGALGPVLFTALKILPLVIFSGLLTYLYIFMPNGKVRFKPALAGGVAAGIIYQAVQWAYIHFQIGVSSAGAIYGTFAALPLFLTWLQLSWRIVLYGAEFSFACQNESKFEFEEDCLKASEDFKKLMALRIAQLCISRFSSALPPLSDDEIAQELEMPVRLTRDLIARLTQAGILTAVETPGRRAQYQPAQDVGQMTVQFVLDHLEQCGAGDIPVAASPELDKLKRSMETFRKTLQKLPENYLLKN